MHFILPMNLCVYFLKSGLITKGSKELKRKITSFLDEPKEADDSENDLQVLHTIQNQNIGFHFRVFYFDLMNVTSIAALTFLFNRGGSFIDSLLGRANIHLSDHVNYYCKCCKYNIANTNRTGVQLKRKKKKL